MKILCILSTTSIHGGSTKAFLSYCLQMKRTHPELELLVTVPNQGPAFKILTDNNIIVSIIPNRFNTYPPTKNLKDLILFLPRLINHLRINNKAIDKLKRITKSYKPQIIYSNVGVINIGEKIAEQFKIPHIYHLREYQDLDFGMKIMPSLKIYKKRLKRKNHSICITRGIQKHFELTENDSKVIYDGVRTTDSIQFIPNKDKFFLFVGRLEQAKGIDFLLNSFSKYCKKERSYNLLLVGAANSRQEETRIKHLISSLSISDRVQMLGVKNDVDNYMKKATATIVTSPFEGFGMVTAEAMFNGCLVIGRNTAGTKEQFDNGLEICGKEIGLRFETEEELANLMLQVSTNGISNYFDIITNSQSVVKQLYSIEQCAESVYKYFNEISNNETSKQ